MDQFLIFFIYIFVKCGKSDHNALNKQATKLERFIPLVVGCHVNWVLDKKNLEFNEVTFAYLMEGLTQGCHFTSIFSNEPETAITNNGRQRFRLERIVFRQLVFGNGFRINGHSCQFD